MNFKKLFGKNKNKIFNMLVVLGLVALVTFLMKYNNDKNGDSRWNEKSFSDVGGT